LRRNVNRKLRRNWPSPSTGYILPMGRQHIAKRGRPLQGDMCKTRARSSAAASSPCEAHLAESKADHEDAIAEHEKALRDSAAGMQANAAAYSRAELVADHMEHLKQVVAEQGLLERHSRTHTSTSFTPCTSATSQLCATTSCVVNKFGCMQSMNACYSA
jgi:hypothetical protein